jgi:hypothetical protein
MKKLVLLFLLIVPQICLAVDVTNSATKETVIGDWVIVEVANPGQMSYRIASTSINKSWSTLAFDFIPTRNCIATTAVVAAEFASYKPSYNNSVVHLAYRIPGVVKGKVEPITIIMELSDTYAFFPFKTLTAEMLYKAKKDSKFSFWFLASPNESTFFSLDGFKTAYDRAKKACISNIP